ncbi:hypothetical protein HOV93_13780 [Planctomycetes bacterium FF15]|uniref:Uncharacterized protein n=1 Tax=Bremerella alba TaxID=980252 RepID=A0A7V8V3G2_9BACT|nr:hypothetical protein [Bremerella alba]
MACQLAEIFDQLCFLGINVTLKSSRATGSRL